MDIEYDPSEEVKNDDPGVRRMPGDTGRRVEDYMEEMSAGPFFGENDTATAEPDRPISGQHRLVKDGPA